jgi:hypothetical protein
VSALRGEGGSATGTTAPLHVVFLATPHVEIGEPCVYAAHAARAVAKRRLDDISNNALAEARSCFGVPACRSLVEWTPRQDAGGRPGPGQVREKATLSVSSQIPAILPMAIYRRLGPGQPAVPQRGSQEDVARNSIQRHMQAMAPHRHRPSPIACCG